MRLVPPECCSGGGAAPALAPAPRPPPPFPALGSRMGTSRPGSRWRPGGPAHPAPPCPGRASGRWWAQGGPHARGGGRLGSSPAPLQGPALREGAPALGGETSSFFPKLRRGAASLGAPKPARTFSAGLSLLQLRQPSSIPRQRDFGPGLETTPRPEPVREGPGAQAPALLGGMLVVRPLSTHGRGSRGLRRRSRAAGGRGTAVPGATESGGRARPLFWEL